MAKDAKGLEELQSAELPVFKELSRSCFNRGNGQVDFCRFHPLDPVLACSLDDGRVCIFEGLNHEIPFEEWSRKYWLANADSWVWRIDWNNDGSKLAAGCKNGLVVVWNRSGQKLMECHQHHSLVTCLRWNKKPGGTDTLFVTGDSKGKVIIWNCSEDSITPSFEFMADNDEVRDTCWTTCNTFVTCSTKTKSCNYNSQSTLVIKGILKGRVCSPVMLNQWASVCHDGHLKIWQHGKSGCLKTVTHPESFWNCVDWYHNEQKSLIACGSSSGVSIWNTKDSNEIFIKELSMKSQKNVWTVSFSPDGCYLASLDGDGHVNIWDTQNWKLISAFKTNPYLIHDALSWDSTGRKLALANHSTISMFFC